jgi:REP element-mobilizing transposase RayT
VHGQGLTYHVTNRAVFGAVLFAADDERERFLRLLGAFVVRFGAVLIAWVLIPNHYHLLIRIGGTPLSRLMQEVEWRFAREINDTRVRQGHLFQGRYFDEIVDRPERYVQLLGYIPANAVDAGLTTLDELPTYPWSSSAALHGNLAPLPGHDPALALGVLSSDLTQARAHLRSITSSEVDRMAIRRASHDPQVMAVLGATCRHHGILPEDVLAGRRTPPALAAIAATTRQCRRLGMTDRRIAAALERSRRTLVRLVSTHPDRAAGG